MWRNHHSSPLETVKSAKQLELEIHQEFEVIFWGSLQSVIDSPGRPSQTSSSNTSRFPGSEVFIPAHFVFQKECFNLETQKKNEALCFKSFQNEKDLFSKHVLSVIKHITRIKASSEHSQFLSACHSLENWAVVFLKKLFRRFLRMFQSCF